ncbi:MAG TPA: LamG domain-containing protein, partial [Burkholderiaceae bacterium]|nr:LamG domain-containing protein [Burkholderiaceae bacterium]
MLAFYWVLVGIAGTAQAATYAYRNDVFSYDTPSVNAVTVPWHTGTTQATNGPPACTNYPLGDDDWSAITFASATTPANNFTFTFAGTVYSGLTIYSNGMLVFGTDTSGQWRTFTNATLPDATNIGTYTTGCPGGVLGNAIIPYWTDIVAGTGNATTGASVQYELLGTAPNRRLVISWVNVKLYNQTARYNFQVALYESPSGGLNSNFKYQYTTGSSDGSAATVGVQISTADYTLYSFDQTFIDPVAGSAILWYPANQLAAVGAQYHFDEGTWTGAAGEVKDTSGNGQNAVKVGAATNVANGKVCRGGSFTANTSNTTIDAVSTPVTPASVGSIDFWYNSNVKWNSANAMLFDATKTAANPFFLMKSATGVLTFSVTDSSSTVLTVSSSAQTFALGTWHHVGVSWNLRPGTNQTLLQVFLDGVLNNFSRTTSTGNIAPLSKLFLGDNATSGVTPNGGSPNGTNGFMDEVNIYATEINASQATSDMNATHSCASVDHFHVITAGSAVTCMATPVTIQAHDVNHNLIPLSGVTLSLTTTPGDGTWSNSAGGSINLITNNGGGSGTYVFSNESQ